VPFEPDQRKSQLPPCFSRFRIESDGSSRGGNGSFFIAHEAITAREVGEGIGEVWIDRDCPRKQGNGFLGAAEILQNNT